MIPVEVQRLIGSSFVSFLLSYMLMKAWLPFAPKRPGEVMLRVQLGLLQRVLIHRTQAIVVLAYILVGSLPPFEQSWFLPGTQAAALVSLGVILMLPLRYVFYDRAVGLNNGVPRPYRAFRRFDVRPGKRMLVSNTTITLRGRRTERGTGASWMLFIPSTETQTVTRLLRRYVR